MNQSFLDRLRADLASVRDQGLYKAERVLTTSGERVVPIYWAPSGEWFLVPSGSEAKDFIEGVPAGSKPIDSASRCQRSRNV